MCVADTRRNVVKLLFVNLAEEVFGQRIVLPST